MFLKALDSVFTLHFASDEAAMSLFTSFLQSTECFTIFNGYMLFTYIKTTDNIKKRLQKENRTLKRTFSALHWTHTRPSEAFS